MNRFFLFFAALPTFVTSHGYLTSPKPRWAPSSGLGPKTMLPVEAATQTGCVSSGQTAGGTAGQSQATYPAGSQQKVVWKLTLLHNPDDPNANPKQGVSLYWRPSSQSNQRFADNSLIALTPSIQLISTYTVPDTTGAVTLQWVWVSRDGGYYFSCADITITPATTQTCDASSFDPLNTTACPDSAAGQGCAVYPDGCELVTEYEKTADGACCQKKCNFKKNGVACKPPENSFAVSTSRLPSSFFVLLATLNLAMWFQ